MAAVLSYMAKRGPGPELLFRLEDGRPLTCQTLVSSLRVVLQGWGLTVASTQATASELELPLQRLLKAPMIC